MKKTAVLFIITAAMLAAQSTGPGGPGRPGGRGGRGSGPGPGVAALVGPAGTWWRDPAIQQSIGLTADQQKKIEDEFQQNRLHLIDLTAAVEKEQVTMEPLVAADHPDEAKILVQIDRIAQARAELEKANARMLLGFRNVLTQDQWTKLRAERTASGGRQGPPPALPGR
jgi:Spy/CpxP family protein refolding chaperone